MSVVTVVVPTRNSERTLEACLRSVRTQLEKDVELVVVDNGSMDGTTSIARRYADVVESYGPERSAQRNRGAKLGRGDYLLFIDSDMLLAPEVISDCLAAVRQSAAPAVIIPEVTVGEGFWAHCRALERSCYMGDDLIEAARFFRREQFASVGGYDESLVAGEDWDLSARVSSGAKLPRTSGRIMHDEGRIRLLDRLAKKRYYGAAFERYWRKHGRLATRQANVLARAAYFRNWRTLVRHPVLTFGFMSLKVLELTAAAVGFISARTWRTTSA